MHVKFYDENFDGLYFSQLFLVLPGSGLQKNGRERDPTSPKWREQIKKSRFSHARQIFSFQPFAEIFGMQPNNITVSVHTNFYRKLPMGTYFLGTLKNSQN